MFIYESFPLPNIFFLFTTFSRKIPVIERQLLLSSCIDGAAGDSLFLRLSEKATGTAPEQAGLAREHRWGESSSWQRCGLRPQNGPLKPGFLLTWASREIGKVKSLMKWTGVEQNSEPQSLTLDEDESLLELHELRQTVFKRSWSNRGEKQQSEGRNQDEKEWTTSWEDLSFGSLNKPLMSQKLLEWEISGADILQT